MGKIEQRQAKRFKEVAKISIPHLTQFSGVLVDVSKTGCRIHFNLALAIEEETEYEVTIYPVAADFDAITLLAESVWIEVSNTSTEIGFKFLRSTASRLFESYIDDIASKETKTLLEEVFD